MLRPVFLALALTLPAFAHGATLEKQMVKFLVADDWYPQPLENAPSAWKMTFKADQNETWTCVAQVIEANDQVVFYSILDFNVTEDRRVAVSEFLHRANYNMILGNFEIDLNDGEVRYKTSIDVEGGKLSATMIKNLTYANVTTTNRYVSGIRAVANGAEPLAEIKRIEGQ